MRAVERSHARISRFFPVLRTLATSLHQRLSEATMRANSVSVMRSISDSKSKRKDGVRAGMSETLDFKADAEDAVDGEHRPELRCVGGCGADGLVVRRVDGVEARGRRR